MTPYHAEDSITDAVFRLIVLEGSQKGEKIDLSPGRKYIIGRGEDCDIRIDAADKTVSRKHAVLEASPKQVMIENLSGANPVLIKGKPIQKAALKDKGQFCIGTTLYALAKSIAPAASAKKPNKKSDPSLRLVLIAALLLIAVFFVFVIITGNDSPTVSETKTDMMTRPDGGDLPPLSPLDVETRRSPVTTDTLGLSVSEADRQKADEHFRKGMFFYDTGNTSRAVAEWNRAVILHPGHPDAQTWFLRAEKELAEKVKTHFQNAMMHYKYMRYDDAAHEFRLVLELSRDKTSDQYVQALKLLNEIQGN
jgi:tetratricopeptide (TPR) repeat protein